MEKRKTIILNEPDKLVNIVDDYQSKINYLVSKGKIKDINVLFSDIGTGM